MFNLDLTGLYKLILENKLESAIIGVVIILILVSFLVIYIKYIKNDGDKIDIRIKDIKNNSGDVMIGKNITKSK